MSSPVNNEDTAVCPFYKYLNSSLPLLNKC